MTKPFDLTKPVQTRDGKEARIICSDWDSEGGLKVIALIKNGYQGKELIRLYKADGSYYHDGRERLEDLVNVPERMSKWANLYEEEIMGTLLPSRKEADLLQTLKLSRIGVLELIFEDGIPVSQVFHKDD